MNAQFAYSLVHLMKHATGAGCPAELFFSLGTLIVNQRESLIRQAMNAGATHILWLDADMTFPPDTLVRLLEREKTVVAANYAQRRNPVKSVAFKKAYNWESYLLHNNGENQTGLTQVEGVGMGCMLVNMSVYEKMKEPRFGLTWDPKVGDHHGEDMFHCDRIREVGEKIWIDCDLTKQVSHLGDFPYRIEMVTKPPKYF